MAHILGRPVLFLCRHEWMHRMAPGRWWLECFKCGRTTRGLTLPGLTLPGSQRRPAGGSRMVPKSDSELLRVMRAEFLEMPGLRLTIAQAQRLWNLDRLTCERMLQTLVETGFLRGGSDAAYMWVGSDSPWRPGALGRRPSVSTAVAGA